MPYLNTISGGNVDTEAGTGGQNYTTPNDAGIGANDLGGAGIQSGNVNSDMGLWQFPSGHRYNEIGGFGGEMQWWRDQNAPQSAVYPNRPAAPQMQKMDYYQALGQQLRSALTGQPAPQQQVATQTAPLSSGFDMDWLSQRLAAGSANGAKIGGMGSGGGGGGGGSKSSSSGDAESNPGSWGQDTSMGKPEGPNSGSGEGTLSTWEKFKGLFGGGGK